MLSNVFIQLNIDYTYHVQYPNLNEKKKKYKSHKISVSIFTKMASYIQQRVSVN